MKYVLATAPFGSMDIGTIHTGDGFGRRDIGRKRDAAVRSKPLISATAVSIFDPALSPSA